MKKPLALIACLLALPVVASTPIINGTPMLPSEAPWSVFIGKGEAGHQWCSGSLIAKRWILTAAHCFDDMDPREYVVRAGGNGQMGGLVQLPPVKAITKNAAYPHPTGDIALVELLADVPDEQNISVIPLADGSASPTTGQVRVAGWGSVGVRWSEATRTEDIVFPGFGGGDPMVIRGFEIPPIPTFLDAQRLTMLELPVLDGEALERAHDMEFFRDHPKYLHPDILVLRSFGYTTCGGDSGAGWAAAVAGGGHELLAVHIAGDQCVSLALGNSVLPHLDWIRAVMRE